MRNVSPSPRFSPDVLSAADAAVRNMAAATEDPHGASLGESDGAEWSSDLPEDSFSSGAEEPEGDDEEEPTVLGNKDEDTADSKDAGNAGWADAMAKVLNKKVPKSQPTILLKNKVREKERKKEKQERLEKRKQLDKKREWEMMCRVKPDVAKDRDFERNLQRIATRGVVQLFNAVRKHQRNIDEKMKEAGSSDRKRAKLISSVSKRDFISVLRGMDGTEMEQSSARKSLKTKQGQPKSEEGPAWSILRDDFMMGASMKDWDKQSDGESSPAQDHGIEVDSGSDSDQ